MDKIDDLVHIAVSGYRCQVFVPLKRWKRLLIVLALGVVFDDLLANHAAPDLRAPALLDGLLGLARCRRLPARLISEGACATDGRSTLRELSRVPGCVSGVFASFG